MRRLWTYFVVGSIMTAGSAAFAGGLPASDNAAATAGSTAQSTTAEATTASSSASTASAASSTATASNADNTATTTAQQVAQAPASNDGVETGSFVAIEEDPLIIDASSVVDGDGVGSMQVQWQISEDGAIWSNLSGEIRQSFTPRERHVGRCLRVQLSHVDGQGNLETILSPASTPVQNVNDKPNGAPQLVGAAREEDALVVDTSMISTMTASAISRSSGSGPAQRPTGRHFPRPMAKSCSFRSAMSAIHIAQWCPYSDGHGTKELLVTSPSETVQNVDDPVQGEVLITGEATEGSTILVSTNGVSDEDGIASMSVGWEASTDGRNWRTIETAGATQLSLSQMLVNKQIRARVAVVDTFGVETVIFSQATNTVQNVNNKPAGTIFVRRVGG